MRVLLGFAKHPATRWLLVIGVVVGLAAWLAGPGPAVPSQMPSLAMATVEVPMRTGVRSNPHDGPQITVTVRWGHPAGRTAAAESMQWDGYLALDCGDIERVEPLAMETDLTGDHVGPVVRGEAADQRVYWRSRTENDWDGLKVQLSACKAQGQDAGRSSSLRIVTPQKTYVARLDWSVDDFVSIKIANDGSSLDVHIAADRDLRAVRGARITAAPADPGAPVAVAPMPEAPVADGDTLPVH